MAGWNVVKALVAEALTNDYGSGSAKVMAGIEITKDNLVIKPYPVRMPNSN